MHSAPTPRVSAGAQVDTNASPPRAGAAISSTGATDVAREEDPPGLARCCGARRGRDRLRTGIRAGRRGGRSAAAAARAGGSFRHGARVGICLDSRPLRLAGWRLRVGRWALGSASTTAISAMGRRALGAYAGWLVLGRGALALAAAPEAA